MDWSGFEMGIDPTILHVSSVWNFFFCKTSPKSFGWSFNLTSPFKLSVKTNVP